LQAAIAGRALTLEQALAEAEALLEMDRDGVSVPLPRHQYPDDRVRAIGDQT
jgi:hypothetical protein